jgi:hypothetical protein
MYINAAMFNKNIGIEKNNHNDSKLPIKYEKILDIE